MIKIKYSNQFKRNDYMPINQLETNLSAITITIAHLEKEGCDNEELLNGLKKERDRLLKELNIK